MDNGLVGTAMGYDTGMIQNDGTLNPSFAARFNTPRPTQDVKKTPQKPIPAIAANPAQKTQQAAPKISGLSLNDAVSELWTACLNTDDDIPMYQAFAKVQTARLAQRGGLPMTTSTTISAPPAAGSKRSLSAVAKEKPPKLTKEEAEPQRQQLFETVVSILKAEPSQSSFLCKLANDNTVKTLKTGAVFQFKKWLDLFPTVFYIAPVQEGSPQYTVNLLDNGVAAVGMDATMDAPGKRNEFGKRRKLQLKEKNELALSKETF